MKGILTLEQKTKIDKIKDNWGIFLVLLAMIAIATILTGGRFLSSTNLLNIMRQQAIIGFLSLGVMLTIVTGGIDLSSGSLIALCSVVIATLAQPIAATGAYHPLIVPLAVGILVGAACGLINGIFVAYANVPPFIATLGMMTAARGMAMLFTDGRPVSGFSESFNHIGRGSWFNIPIPIYLLVAGAILMYLILQRSRFGTHVYAIGGNENAAIVSGVNAKRVKMTVYLIAGAFTGMGAIVLASRTLAGNPGSGVGFELDAITGAVIGGTSFSGGIGKVYNVVIGVLIMGVLTNTMTIMQINPHNQMIVRGAVIVFAVMMDQRNKVRKN